MKTIARLAAATLALTGSGLAAACSSDSGEDETLTVCTNVPFVPFESREGDEYVGFDMDLMDLLAERLDQTVEVVEIDFDAIQSGAALNNNTCDIAAAGLSITEERQEAMGMSQAYYRADQSLAAPADSGVASLDDLDGVQVGVQTATTGEAYANDIADQYGFEVRSFDNMGDIASALSTDTVQASIADVGPTNAMVEDTEGLALIETFETDEHYAFAVQKDDTELLDEVDAMLDEAFEDGTYAEIYEKWIGEPYTEGAVE
ncbi:transporter substrate-binding domain-containing protein [Glycomyces salinus]|uniref:transporter substrate-binding domain-containing protein n=1 Tax=Glycomyces salinus TaxID=980294 RepID=UPI0018EBB329|nr:transporter substrate-binding domain-containing protein [Glycomyces salinus]